MSALASFHFMRPLWLLALLPLAWLVWRLLRERARPGAWAAVCDAHLLPHLLTAMAGRRSRLPVVLLACAWLLSVVALAGPVWSRLPQPVYRSGDAAVVVLQLSQSMDAADLQPSRLVRARLKVLDFLERRREGQTALVAYAGEPYVVSPLTDDARTIAALVPSLATDLVAASGDRLGDALDRADVLLTGAGVPRGGRVLVVACDAGDSGAIERAQALRAKGRVVSVLAVGTRGGAPVAMPGGGFLQDETGAIEIPRLNSAGLQRLAQAGGGRMAELSADSRDLDSLWPARAPRAQDGKQVMHSADVWREEGPWLLFLVLPLAALAFRRGWLGLVLVAAVGLPPPAHAFAWRDLWLRPDQQAARALDRGYAVEAAQHFRDPRWKSIAQYRAGRYPAAAAGFASGNGVDAAYNRGNALAHAGDLQGAAAAYRSALSQRPDDTDARHNLKIVEDLMRQRAQAQSRPQSKGAEGRSQPSSENKGGAQQGSKGAQSAPGEHKPSGGSQAQDQGGKGAPDANDTRQKGNANASSTPGGTRPDAKDASRPHDRNAAGAQSAGRNKERSGEESQQAKSREGAATHRASAQPAASDAKAAAKAGQGDTKNAAEAEADGPPPSEADQALEQWLRRIPDDPGGLLRREFLLQHQQRAQAQ